MAHVSSHLIIQGKITHTKEEAVQVIILHLGKWHLECDWNVHIKFRSTETQTHVCLTSKYSCKKLQTHDHSLEKCGGMGP